MSKLLVIVRHGEYGGGDSSALSAAGRMQMESLKCVINTFIAKTFGNAATKRLCFSFSGFPRAIESIQKLRTCGEDIVLTNLYWTEREQISSPKDILDNVLGLADYYCADIITIVAHGVMPAVIAETAHEFVTGKTPENELASVGKGQGYMVDMSTGEITAVSYVSQSVPQ
jgi:hypothetical protein